MNWTEKHIKGLLFEKKIRSYQAMNSDCSVQSKKCEQCGKSFIPYRSNQILCSKRCNELKRNEKDRSGLGKNWSAGKEYVPRQTCIVCGNLFYAPPAQLKRGGNAGKFCSNKCYGKHNTKEVPVKERRAIKKRENKIPKEPRPEVKLTGCENCGRLIKKKFCDQKCYTEFRNKQDKRITKQCLNCKKDIKVSVGQHNAGFGIYCSSSCAAVARVNNRTVPLIGNAIGGKRQDLNNQYFRSRWEANYARYLNFMIKRGEVLRWEYEPKTFYFQGIKRGTISYTPDFKVYYPGNIYKWIEIKGYMDDRSKTRMKRMEKYFPDEPVEIIEVVRYKALSKAMKSIIPFWEVNANKSY